MSDQPQLSWQDPHWLKQATDWIRSEAQRQSIRIAGNIEQPHIYPWATVLRVPTNEGTLFFKASASETAHEAALLQKLAAWLPDCMPELVAADTARGWMLMRDGGEQLRASIRPAQDIAPWKPILSKYAEVQIGLADHISELLSIGVPDYRLPALPGLYTKLITDVKSLNLDQPKGLTSDELRRLEELSPRFEQICAQLAAYDIPASLNHGDFHDGNVLLKNGRVTFLDWADAGISHPFVSLRTFFVSIEIALDLEDYSFTPEMAALLDHYLELWQRFGSRDELLAAYQLSKCAASIVKADNWHLTISNIKGPRREEYAWIVPELLKEFLVYEKKLSN